MNRRNIVIFILKYLIIPALIITILDIYAFIKFETIPIFDLNYLKLYIILVIFTAIFWSFISYLELRVGELMEANWKQRIVFIIIALVLIYLYRATGRI